MILKETDEMLNLITLNVGDGRVYVLCERKKRKGARSFLIGQCFLTGNFLWTKFLCRSTGVVNHGYEVGFR